MFDPDPATRWDGACGGDVGGRQCEGLILAGPVHHHRRRPAVLRAPDGVEEGGERGLDDLPHLRGPGVGAAGQEGDAAGGAA